MHGEVYPLVAENKVVRSKNNAEVCSEVCEALLNLTVINVQI